VYFAQRMPKFSYFNDYLFNLILTYLYQMEFFIENIGVCCVNENVGNEKMGQNCRSIEAKSYHLSVLFAFL